MAITTMDGLIAALAAAQRPPYQKANLTAVAGRTLSMWTAAGNPATGDITVGNSTAGAVPTSATTGAVLFTNPVSGNTHIARAEGINGSTGAIVIWDMLYSWASPTGWVATTTGAQSTVSPPALTRPDANGTNTELWVETLAAGGAASGTSTITYTNSAGTGSRTASLLATKISSPPIGTMEQYALAAGDNGVKSIQSINNSATWTSGTFRVMILRRLLTIPASTNVAFMLDALATGLPKVDDSACLLVSFTANSTATGPLSMNLALAQG